MAAEVVKSTLFTLKLRRTQRTTDDECKIDALKNLDLLELIKVTDKNGNCSTVAAEVFQERYANKHFVIRKNPDLYDDSVDSVDSSEVLVSDLTAATTMINRFGHFIRELAIMFSEDECDPSQMDQVLNILTAIDAHCSESLVDFALNYRGCNGHNIFDQIRGPFERVEVLKCNLYDMNGQTKDHQLQLNTVFPNVRQLSVIALDHLNDSLVFDCELPALEKLHIGDNLNHEPNQSILIDLLKRNPQISRVSLFLPTFQTLQYVSKYLIQLQELDIIMKSPEKFNSEKTAETETIQFSTVKYLILTVVDEQCRPPNGISFNEAALKEISLGCDSGNQTDEYVNFILKYPKIQTLGAGSGLHSAILQKLVGKFTELSYVAFDFDEDVSADNIIEFVEHSPALNQLEFVHANIKDFGAFEKQLKTELGTDFNMKIDDMIAPFSKKVLRKISIERKMPIVVDAEKAANAACNAFHNSVVMFIIVFASRFH